MGIKNLFFHRCKRVLGSGCQTRFWEDCWHGDSPLAEQFPRLFANFQ